MTSRRRTTIFCVSVLAVATGLVSLWFQGSGKGHELSVSFNGFTNVGTGNLAARFCVTNGTPVEVMFSVLSLERKSEGSWLPTSFGAGIEPVMRDDHNSLPDWLIGKTKLSGPLPTGKSQMVLLPVVDTNSIYRVRFAGVEPRRGFAGVRDQFKMLYARLIERRSLRIYLGRRYELASEDPSP